MEMPDSQPATARTIDAIESLAAELEAIDAAEQSADPAWFWEAVRCAAQASGCRALFELPAAMIDQDAGRAAAIATDEAAIAFVVLENEGTPHLRIADSETVEDSVLAFARSYAGVLGMLACFAGSSEPSLPN